MSYILDALRKADAERERDPARGIHAQPMVAAAAQRRRAFPLAWIAFAAVVAAAAVGAYALRQSGPSSVPTRTATAGGRVQSASAVPATVTPPPGRASPVTVANAVQPAAPPMPPPAPPPVARPVLKAQAPVAQAAPEAPAAVAPAVAAPRPAAADRVFAFSDLPSEVQSQLPKLVITGGVHSANASQRMLIVGGQVVSEGAEVAPGVVLEQIRAKAAVLRFRDYRYSVGY